MESSLLALGGKIQREEGWPSFKGTNTSQILTCLLYVRNTQVNFQFSAGSRERMLANETSWSLESRIRGRILCAGPGQEKHG